jgi:alpha-glucosidase
VLALRRDLRPDRAGAHEAPAMLAAFELSIQPVDFDWPEAAGADEVGGHGLPGSRAGARVALPPYGAWYGTVKAACA